MYLLMKLSVFVDEQTRASAGAAKLMAVVDAMRAAAASFLIENEFFMSSRVVVDLFGRDF